MQHLGKEDSRIICLALLLLLLFYYEASQIFDLLEGNQCVNASTRLFAQMSEHRQTAVHPHAGLSGALWPA